jgi:predicted hydrocarbon binding protein/DNA-binding transcriptional regulator YhcF (GntR family)
MLENIKSEIIDLLKHSNHGTSTIEIAKKIGVNRLTVSKYLSILKEKGIINYKRIGMAKSWYIKNTDFTHIVNHNEDFLNFIKRDKVTNKILMVSIYPMFLVSDNFFHRFYTNFNQYEQEKLFYDVTMDRLNLYEKLNGNNLILNNDPEAFIKKWLYFQFNGGLGKIGNISLDKDNKVLNIQLENNFYEESIRKHRKNDDKTVSYALQGIFKAVMEKIYKEEFSCSEIKCAFNGGNYCEFVVSQEIAIK